MNKEIERVFASDGELAHFFPNFQPRQSQTDMSNACFTQLREGGILLAEAGTGIGKTFAYGVAALLSGRKVVISTATKSLQDQLSKRDLPALCQALSMPAKIQVLKGRENYLCNQRLEQVSHQLSLGHQKGWQMAVHEVKHWAFTSHRGELSEVLGDRSHPLWDKVCARHEFCALASCDADRCAYPQQRKDAETSDVLVINHHLLGADLALKMAGLPSLLPERAALIVDEAHQLVDVMTQALGHYASTAGWGYALRELQTMVMTEIRDMPSLLLAIEQLLQALSDWQMLVQGQKFRCVATEWLSQPAQHQVFTAFVEKWRNLLPWLAAASERSPTIKAQASLLGRLADVTLRWGQSDTEEVDWIEAQNEHWHLYITPLSVADVFSNQVMKHYQTLILTSATLSAGGQFEHLQRQLGLWDANTQVWPSPFDYPSQSMLYLPDAMPEPSDPDYVLHLMRRVWPLLLANGGKAFLLFTSIKAMSLAASILRPHLPFPILVQGEQDAHQLIQVFRQKGNAVLLATASFWEGVDVAGSALSLVVIDKIPFSPPDDPVAQAREARLQEKGLSAFVCEQLPNAMIALVQGAGRLIRSENDRGVLVIGDPRLRNRRYGQQILNALPAMLRTHSQAQVLEFIESLQGCAK